jgi:hypothetical protein
MDVRLNQLLKDLERFETINKSDIPDFVKLVRDLDASAKLAWLQLELNEQSDEE